jgi:hypothetical protein
LVGSDGGVFAYGDATFLGSMGDKVINGWIVGISSTKNGKGYYLQGSDGAIYAFGNATYQGGLFFPPPSISLTSNPTPVWSGSPETISWNITNAAGATIYLSGDGVLNNYGPVDSAIVIPHNLGLTTYTLTVIGAGGTDNLPFQINVVVPPPIVNIYSQSNVITWNIQNASNGKLTITGPKGETVYGPQTEPSQGVYVYGGTPGDYIATMTATNTTWSDSRSVKINIPSIPPSSIDIISSVTKDLSGLNLTPDQVKFFEGLSKPTIDSCLTGKNTSSFININQSCIIKSTTTSSLPSVANCIVWYSSITGNTLGGAFGNGNKIYTGHSFNKTTLSQCKDAFIGSPKSWQSVNNFKDHYQWNNTNYK